ncbi:chorismate lyase [Aliikangiella sp. G2MR2-5]|uniref:chorismate--pyruvate lyase family protein n=1 Tax=Aliikangiella sp. G2MR2-5 TaxID=2788943 RepID=UPI0018AA0C47|nr:chorismate lyase [Aliikangiella sp. G2MR2-5]
MKPEIFALLSDRGSLTGRFQQVMGVKPRLTRLSQGREFVSKQEREILGIPEREMALVREIKMGKGENNWLFARTVVPNSTLRGSARRIIGLKNTPIGKILFGRQGASRTSLNVELTENLPVQIERLRIELHHPLWQRQSIFEFASGPLLVTEVFLPDCPIYDV